MLVASMLSSESVDLLKMRGQSDQQVSDFAALLSDANEQMGQEVSAKQVLSELSVDELSLVQKSVGLVDPINVALLSDEAAINLLAQPDTTGMVDLNNDGIVEVGAARMIVFPPVNAPESVQLAWDDATEGMSEKDKMIMQLHMHTSVYGVHIDGVSDTKVPSPDIQWGRSGIEQLFEQLRSALEFSVALDGWDRFNLEKKDFYDRFEQSLSETENLTARMATSGGVI
jgi:hypothetical protein